MDVWSAKAFVRAVGDNFSLAVTSFTMPTGASPVLDPDRARRQHDAYVAGLHALGFEVHRFASDPAFPDGCFIEDTVVLARGLGLLTRSAHPARRGEGVALADVYRAHGVHLVEMEAPATLDGGDVLVVGDVLYVGLTARTHSAALQVLDDVFRPVGLEVRAVQVPEGILHLKCVVSSPAPGTVVLAAETLPPGLFVGTRVIVIPATERYAANTVGRDGRVMVASGFPGTRDALESAGLDTVCVDTSEFR